MKSLLAVAALQMFSVVALADNRNYNYYEVKPDRPQQTIEHFGASDAWSMQFAGLWPESQQEQVADWLFSTENDAQGKPKGIGLSIWRFNLGAGSAEQGDGSKIQYGTRTECIVRPDGSYDWTKQRGQRKFLQLAKQRGVNCFLAFLNSAPVYLTDNGLATNTGRGGNINLKKGNFGKFADFITTAIKGLQEHDGIKIDYVSPVNEPDGSWNWLGPKQEGSPATNREIAALTRKLDKDFRKNRLQTKIILNESSDIRCLLGVHQTDWQRGNTLHTLFGRDSTGTYIGNLSSVAPLIAAHSYWTNTPLDFMRSTRMALRDSLKRYGLKYWQTEICIMGNDEEIGGGNGYDFSMKTALYVARIIHYDLVYGNACSWSWWRSMGGDYRDGLLRVYSNDNWATGSVTDSKLLWSLGNFSRFVRPGAKRFDMVAYDDASKKIEDGCSVPDGVMCSAYQNADGTWCVVAINYANEQRPFNFSVAGSSHRWKEYRTSNISYEDLYPVGETDGKTTLFPRSITTFVSE